MCLLHFLSQQVSSWPRSKLLAKTMMLKVLFRQNLFNFATCVKLNLFVSVLPILFILRWQLGSPCLPMRGYALKIPSGSLHLHVFRFGACQNSGRIRCSPFHSNLFVPKGQRSLELMMLDTSHASQPWEGGRGAPLCGPPPRRSLERGGIAVRAALAACQNGSRCCATSLGRRSRAQRNRSRQKRSTF